MDVRTRGSYEIEAPGGEADAIGTKADIGARMSPVGGIADILSPMSGFRGRADVIASGPELPVLAISGHSVHDSSLEHFFELTNSLFPCRA